VTIRLCILAMAGLLVTAACTSSSPTSNDKTNAASRTTTTTAVPATTASTAAPTGCPTIRPAAELASPANLADLQMVSPQKGYAVGRGTILGTDDGHSWTPRYSGGATFLSVDAVDPVHAWAVGDRALYDTVDGGHHWVGDGSPDDGTVLRQVHFVDEHFGWGVGAGKLYRSGDGGHTWGQLMPPCGAEAVCFTSQEEGWVAVGNRIAHSTSGGDEWNPVFAVPGEAEVNGWHPQALQCAAGGVVWALFTGNNAATSHSPYVIYRGTADGQWTAVLKEGMTAPKEIQARREGGTYPGPMSALGTDSAAFVLFTPPQSPNPVGVVVASTGGTTFGPTRPIPPLTSPTAISFLNATTGWVLGTKTPTGTGPSVDAVLATADGGQTWQEQYSRPSPTH
jgi:photosystem II stability/assembly factor-like uncharacterized protein